MSERQSDSMRFKRELDEHITKSDESPAAVSEEVRKLAGEILCIGHNKKEQIAQLLADALAAQALETAEHIRTGPHEGCHGACCKALRKERERARRELIQDEVIELELRPETSISAADEVTLVRRDGFQGRRWGVKRRGYVLNKSGEWEHEPIPSSRTEEWLQTVRWENFEDAIRALAAQGASK